MSRRACHAQLGDPLRVEPRVFWPLFDTIRTAPFLADFAVWSDGHIRAPHFLLASCVHGLCPGGERSQDPCIAQQSVINPYRTQDHSGCPYGCVEVSVRRRDEACACLRARLRVAACVLLCAHYRCSLDGDKVTRYEVHIQNTVSGDPHLLRVANHGSSKRMNRSPEPSTSSRSRGPTTTVVVCSSTSNGPSSRWPGRTSAPRYTGVDTNPSGSPRGPNA